MADHIAKVLPLLPPPPRYPLICMDAGSGEVTGGGGGGGDGHCRQRDELPRAYSLKIVENPGMSGMYFRKSDHSVIKE